MCPEPRVPSKDKSCAAWNNWDIPYPKECNKSAFKRHNITENRYFTFNIVNKPSENLHQWTCMSETWWLKSRKYINNIRKLQTRRNYKQHCYCFSLNKHLVIFKGRNQTTNSIPWCIPFSLILSLRTLLNHLLHAALVVKSCRALTFVWIPWLLLLRVPS